MKRLGRGRRQPQINQETQNLPPPKVRVSSVLFVEQTKGGLLAKELRSTMKSLSSMMGFSLKIVVNAGSSLQETKHPI